MKSFKDWQGKKHKEKPVVTSKVGEPNWPGKTISQVAEGLISYKEFKSQDDLVQVEGYGRVSRRQAKELCLEKLNDLVTALNFGTEFPLHHFDLAKAFYAAYRS